jgi:hypothetical protein
MDIVLLYCHLAIAFRTQDFECYAINISGHTVKRHNLNWRHTGENDEIVSKSADTRAHDSSVTDTIVELYFYCETGYIFSLMIAGYDRLFNRRIVNKVTFTARYLTASSTDRDEMGNGKEQSAV